MTGGGFVTSASARALWRCGGIVYAENLKEGDQNVLDLPSDCGQFSGYEANR